MNDFLNYDNCINTYSGLKLNFADPSADQIDISDIAKGLSFRGHFGGQTQEFFSIAQHSLMVLSLLNESGCKDDELRLAALLHDASEAYTGDMVKPLKIMLPEFKKIEDQITDVIFKKFDIPIEFIKEIKPFDIEAQTIEYYKFFKGRYTTLYSLSPEESYRDFIKAFNELTRNKKDDKN